ncbi:MAG: hypothetical protein KF729_14745 [Sandaracinaceae bacterium]|nr:hypothetical protein [Sandaracinaceae bacterium]
MRRDAMLLLALLGGCGGEAEPEAPGRTDEARQGEAPEDRAPGPSADGLPAAAFDGTVVAVGPYLFEVRAHVDGLIDVHVHPGATAPPPPTARVSVTLTADDGAQHRVLTTWDPAEDRFRGRLFHVHAIPGPIRVTLVDGDATYEGRASTVVVAPPGPPRPPSAPRRPGTAEPGSRPPPRADRRAGSAARAPAPAEPAPARRAPIAPPRIAPALPVARPPQAVPSVLPPSGPLVRPAPAPLALPDRRARATDAPRTERTIEGDAVVRPRE